MQTTAELSFIHAFFLWLDSRVRISPATRHDYTKNFRRMQGYFGPLRLQDITIHHLHEYRRIRQLACGPNRINKELNMLQQILRRFGLWSEIGKWYERLPQPKSEVGIALEPEEEAHLFRVAASQPRWKVAYLTSLISRNTCACPGELRLLTFANIDTENFAWIRIVRGTKNDARKRTLTCNADAQWALKQLYLRAIDAGAKLPTHYLLYARGPDVTKPQMDWHKGWHALRKKAAETKGFERLGFVRLYDMRHSACTRLLENPAVPYATIEELMGHRLASDTKRIYTHVRDASLRAAVDAICSRIMGAGDTGQG